MAYGSKRGIKTPGEYTTSDFFGLASAGAAGILAALVTDYRQKGESSSLYTINQWVVSLGEIFGVTQVPLWSVVAGLVAIGAGSIFYFQPITRQGAFAQGFGLLAVMMTAVPADLAAGLQSTGPALQELEPVSIEAAIHDPQPADGIVAASFQPAAPQQAQPQVTRVAQASEMQNRGGARYVVELNIEFPNGAPADIDDMIRRGTLRGRLHNEETGSTYNLFRTAGGDVMVRGNSVVIRAGVPARSKTGRLWVRIECDGYAIEEQSAEANLDTALVWTVNMQPSSTPLFLQRLGKTYWF
jgi:hypothetical protein